VSNRSLHLLFLLLLATGAAFVLATSGALPASIATHFGAAGRPDAYMTRAGYQLYMLLMSVGFPVLLVGAIGWLPRRFPRRVNLPHRDYWMAPERREQTLALLARRALWLGCAVVVFVCAMHWLLLRANQSTPPQLPVAPFLVLLAGFLGFIAIWGIALHRAFRKDTA
jgi:hypothetical protein